MSLKKGMDGDWKTGAYAGAGNGKPTRPPDKNERFRVVVVDDHDVVRAGLRAVLSECGELDVVGEAASVEEALGLCAHASPQIVLLDLHLPDRSGVEACREIKLAWPSMKVLFLTSYGDEANVLAGLAAGADGYLLKTITGGNIADAVLTVARGGVVLDPLVTRKLIGHLSPPPSAPAQELSPKEQRIFDGVVTGQLNKEIASALGISEKTVRNHLTTIYQKLGVKTRAEAAVRHQQLNRR